MDRKRIVSLLAATIPLEHIQIDEPMASHTSFKIGGPADVFIAPATEEQVMHAVKVCVAENIPYYVIGNGSNLLVSSKGMRGVVIELFKNFASIEVEETCITAYSGALLSRIANRALENNLTGFEFAQGIPGTLGGAVTMNAGAYGEEMKGVLVEATVLDKNGDKKTLSLEELALGYRTSVVQTEGYIVLKATIKLMVGEREKIVEKMKDLASRRKEKQPLEYPSAGSTFKRPTGYFAGKLIMDCDLRGYKIGGAQVSEKHCGFVINADNASYEDVINLIEYVKLKVKEKFQVDLEPEVRIIGE